MPVAGQSRGTMGQNITRTLRSLFGRQAVPPQGEDATSKFDPWSVRRFAASFLADWGNLDNAVLRRERSADAAYLYPYGIFDEMLAKDPHIAAAVALRKDAVLDCDMQIVAADDTPDADFLGAWCTWAIDQIGVRGGIDWRGVTASFLDAVWYGMRICEFIWEPAVYRGRNYWVIREIKPRPPRRFTFNADDELQLITAIGGAQAVSANKFVLCRLYPADDSPWGDPLLARLYFLFRFKKAVVGYWIAYCEKYGMPIPVGTTEAGAAVSDDNMAAFDRVLESLQQDMYARLQQGQKIEMLEFARGDATKLYDTFLQFANREISKLCLGATMIMEESSTGARSMAVELGDRFTSKVQSDAQSVGREWTRGVLRPLVEMNFGTDRLALCPEMTLTSAEEGDLELESKVDTFLVETGIPLSMKQMYQRYGRSAPETPDDTVKRAAPPPQLGMPPSVAALFGASQNVPEPLGRTTPPPRETKIPARPGGMPPQTGQTAWNEDTRHHAESTRKGRAVAIRADGDRQAALAATDLREGLRAGFENILTQMKRAVAQYATPDEAVKQVARNGLLAYDTSELERALRAVLKTAFLRGFTNGAGVMKLRRTAPQTSTTTAPGRAFAEHHDPDAVEFDSLAKAIGRAEALNVIRRKEFDLLDAWARSESFTAANQTLDTIHGALQDALLGMIRDGNTIEEGIARLYPEWNPPKGATDVPFQTEAHIENVLRTNGMRAYNSGWNDVAMMPELAGDFPAAEFVAVMDDRTTEICASLDGSVVMRDQVAELTPPLHYECRSILVFITPEELTGYSAGDIVRADEVRSGPEAERPLEGFGYYRPLIAGG